MRNEEYGFLPGRYPAIVREYNQARRTCRVEIPGLTDGGDVLPEAELEYALGDRSRAGQYETEYHIMPGDAVWIAFVGGDPRYPIVTGFRNPQSGNSADWRRWYHRNMELLAAELMNLIAGGDILIQSGTKITLKAPEVLLDTGNVSANGNIAATGNVSVNGNIAATGAVMDGGGNSNHHSH